MENNIPMLDCKFYKPHDWQMRLHLSPATYKCAIGGFGSGKTWWLFMQSYFLAYYQPNNYGVIMRKTYDELDITTKKIFLDNMPPGAFKRVEYTKRIYTLPNNSVIIFRAFDKWDKIKNLNIGFFAIDQGEEFPESYFDVLITRFKLKIPVKYEGLIAANSAGKNWIWRQFVKNLESPNPDPDYACEISTTEQNRKYLPPGYIERLERRLSPKMKSRYLGCSFDSFEGLVYYNYNAKKCQMNMTDMKFNTPEYKIIVAIDPGLDAPTAVLFGAFSVKNYCLYLFDEIYEPHMTPKQIKLLIDKKLEKWHIENTWKIVIDPHSKATDMPRKPSVFNEYRACGLNVQPAENDVNIGVLRVNILFGNDPTATRIFTNISLDAFYSEIEEWLWDIKQKQIELGISSKDKPCSGNDHLMDDLKYIVLALPVHWVDEDMRAKVEKSEEERKKFEGRFKRGRL